MAASTNVPPCSGRHVCGFDSRGRPFVVDHDVPAGERLAVEAEDVAVARLQGGPHHLDQLNSPFDSGLLSPFVCGDGGLPWLSVAGEAVLLRVVGDPCPCSLADERVSEVLGVAGGHLGDQLAPFVDGVQAEVA
jgi:hypothetical protein